MTRRPPPDWPDWAFAVGVMIVGAGILVLLLFALASLWEPDVMLEGAVP